MLGEPQPGGGGCLRVAVVIHSAGISTQDSFNTLHVLHVIPVALVACSPIIMRVLREMHKVGH